VPSVRLFLQRLPTRKQQEPPPETRINNIGRQAEAGSVCDSTCLQSSSSNPRPWPRPAGTDHMDRHGTQAWRRARLTMIALCHASRVPPSRLALCLAADLPAWEDVLCPMQQLALHNKASITPNGNIRRLRQNSYRITMAHHPGYDKYRINNLRSPRSSGPWLNSAGSAVDCAAFDPAHSQ
jgi:hypothetical protein